MKNGYPMDGVYFGNGDEFAEEGRGKTENFLSYTTRISICIRDVKAYR